MAVKIKVSERDVQASCLQYLEMKGYFFFRLNNIPIPKEGYFRAMPKHQPRGLPDAVVIKGGKFIAIEFKGSVGKISEDQAEIGRRIITAGGDYHIIKSIDDLQKIGL